MVKLIAYNGIPEALIASAARMSTTKDLAIDIFEKSVAFQLYDPEKNRKLISRVLESGHASILEHAVFTFAFENVSMVIEQLMIQHRLTSFTVKSRRYVNFSDAGYYVPDIGPVAKAGYVTYMDAQFKAYNDLIALGIPQEDARMVLPWGFNSNFYCTANAREWAHIAVDMAFGKWSNIPEVRDIGNAIIADLTKAIPPIGSYIAKLSETANAPVFSVATGRKFGVRKAEECGKIEILRDNGYLDSLKYPHPFDGRGGNPRLYELQSYVISIKNISLAALTHLTRHRMQSLVIPPISQLTADDVVILPDSFNSESADGSFEARRIYIEAAMRMSNFIESNLASSVKVARLIPAPYIKISGLMTDVITQINARELIHFIRLRTCERAQWEIRNIAVNILKALRRSSGENCARLFEMVGPECYMTGKCPEGKLSCHDMGNVMKKFRAV